MKDYIALLRGINVGGKNKLPMQALRTLLAELGFKNVKTYIQSGNVFFQSDRRDLGAIAAEIASAIETNHGFAPRVFILSVPDLSNAAKANPFPQAEGEPKTLHLYFLAARADNVDLEKLAALKSNTEEFVLTDSVFYLHAPDGIGRSKLAERAERLLGVQTTARNWRTVRKLMDLASENR